MYYGTFEFYSIVSFPSLGWGLHLLSLNLFIAANLFQNAIPRWLREELILSEPYGQFAPSDRFFQVRV